MKILFTLIFFLSFSSYAVNSKESAVESSMNKVLACRTSLSVKDEEKIVKSLACFKQEFLSTLSSKEQGGMALWFNSLKEVKKVYSCTGEKYQLKSYHRYTPHFICLSVVSNEGEIEEKVIFFKEESGQLRLQSIYTPIKW